MATNPRIPEQKEPPRGGPTIVPKPEKPSSATPGVLLAIVTALLLLVAIVYFVPRAPKSVNHAPIRATMPAQPVPGQLQISDVKMSTAPTGGALNLDGRLSNSGTTDVSGVMAEVDFPLGNGQMAAVQAPVQGIAVSNGTNTGKITGDTEDLTKAPIKPGETRPVRINVSQVPAQWNHQIPQVKVTTTTGTTAK